MSPRAVHVDVKAGQQPALSTAEGEPLAGGLRFLERSITSGPRPVRSACRFGTRALISGRLPLLSLRLPELVATYPDGRRFRIPAADEMYGKIFALGEWEPHESSVVRAFVQPGDFALDIGANHGWFALLAAAAAGPSGRSWAVEPVPELVGALRTNVALNPQLDVEVLPLALGAKSGELEIHTFSGLRHGHASAATFGRDDYTSHRVEMSTVDTILAGAEPPQLIKLDVEGSELAVMHGAAQTLAADAPPAWMVEVNYETSGAFGYKPVALLEELWRHHDYSVFVITGNGLKPERNPEGAAQDAMWFCVPRHLQNRVAHLVR